MEIKFTVHETPRPDGKAGMKECHARVQPRETLHLEDVCEHINEVASLNSSDVKGALEAFFRFLSLKLQSGYSVELEGLGIFSVSLKSRPVIHEKGREGLDVQISGVNFRCAPRLRKAVQASTLTKVKRSPEPFPETEQRRRRMLTYIERRGAINLHQYAAVNSCSMYRAGKDLQAFLEEGLVTRAGLGTHKVYLRADAKSPG